MFSRPGQIFPFLEWGKSYGPRTLANDALAAVIVTIMLIPQSLAYAMLAGLPPQVGLYASMLPLIAYAVFGSSRTLAVGPVAVLSLMTAVAAGRLAAEGSPEYLAAAMLLAFLSGLILLLMGILRLGFLANFLSHPVISGFITASGILIAASQLRHVLGVPADGHNLTEILVELAKTVPDTNVPTLAIGVLSLVFLFWVRSGLQPLLERAGLGTVPAAMVARAGPVVAVVAGILVVAKFGLSQQGVAIVGSIPSGLPEFALPGLDAGLWKELAVSAALISLIGFVESISVAQSLAARRRQRIDPNQELIGLGAANLTSGVSGGYPVTGGFARSAVNFDAGAETPAAGAITAVGIGLAAFFLTPMLFFLPKAVLAATIIVAVLSLVNVSEIRSVWVYSKSDFAAMTATILITLLSGVEWGVSAGVALSLFLHLYNSSRPHFAIVGRVPGTEHFRNILRHDVLTSPEILTLRVDESLYFANARFLEDTVYSLISDRPELKDMILMCPAVNRIDASGLESLEAINERLRDAGVTLHFSEIKGPVMDRLQRTRFLEHLSGNVYLHQFEAIRDLERSKRQDEPFEPTSEG